jgi:hypothetical protein
MRFLQENEGRCFYCGAEVTEFGCQPSRDWLPLKDTAMVLEHKTPIIRGGANTNENITCACSDCNSRKGTFTVQEFRFLMGLRSGDLNFQFACEMPDMIRRKWLICHSADHERDIVIHNIPSAAEAYALRRNSHQRSKTWKPMGARG